MYVGAVNHKALKLNVKMNIRDFLLVMSPKQKPEKHNLTVSFCWLFRLPSPFDGMLYDGHRSKEINLMVAKAQKQTQFG